MHTHYKPNQGRFAFLSFFRGRLSTWGGLRVNNIIFSLSNFTSSPFSVGAVFLPQHGQILDEILDELLTRKYKLILVTLHSSPLCPVGALFFGGGFFAYRFLNLYNPPSPSAWSDYVLAGVCLSTQAWRRTKSPPVAMTGPLTVSHTHTHTHTHTSLSTILSTY